MGKLNLEDGTLKKKIYYMLVQKMDMLVFQMQEKWKVKKGKINTQPILKLIVNKQHQYVSIQIYPV